MREIRVRWARALFVLSAVPAVALAQGPTSIINVGFTAGVAAGGVHFVSQPAGVVTAMGAITPDEAESNAVAFDPWDASIWIGGINAGGVVGAGEIRHLQYSAAGMMTSSVLVTTLPSAGASVSGLAFDHDGFLLASSGAMGYRVTPSTGAFVAIAGPAVPAGTYNAVVAGPVTGNAYFAITAGGGRISMVPRGGAGDVLLGVVSPPSSNATVSGLAVDPAETTLYVTTFGALNDSLLAFPLPGGPAVLLGPPAPALPSLNDVEWDHSTGMLVVDSAGIDPDNMYIVDPVTGANVLLTTVYPAPGGSPANLDINDSGFGLKILPEQIYTPGPFPLCLSLWGTPGCAGSIWIIGLQPAGAPVSLVAPLVLTNGPIDFRGCRATSIAVPPGLFIPGGPNFQFHIVGVTVCPGSPITFTPVAVRPSV